MKGKIHVFVLVFCVFLCAQAYGQTSSPIDLVLLLDTSSGMSSSYENVNNYISGPFLNEYLRVGDTFHLISFSSSPRLDAARRISGVGDIETIVGRMFLQYPVERGANVGAALSYAEQYIISLPNRPKKIVLLSTGSTDTNNLVTSAKSRLSSRNTTLDFVQVTPGQPLSNLPKSGRPPAMSSTSTARPSSSASGAAAVQGTTTTGAAGGSTAQTTQSTQTDTTGRPKAGTTTTSGSGAASTTDTRGTQTQDNRGVTTSTTDGKTTGSGSSSTGAAADTGSGTSSVSSKGTDSKQESTSGKAAETSDKIETKTETSGQTTTSTPIPKTREASSIDWASNLPLIIGIILGLLLLLALILLLSSRKLGSSPNRAMAAASSRSSSPTPRSEERFADHSKDLNSFAAAGSARRSTPYDEKKYAATVINPTGPLLLNLHVEDQNTAIGKRNIHSLKSGYGFSVGGGKSDDYLIFLVPMPAAIGEIRRDGGTLTFTPKKAKYFPDIGSTPVRDCINKTIRVVSDKNYEMRFRFEMYEDPLIALNRVLMQVKVPGMV